MKIKLNKVTWYSKLLAAILFVLIPIASFHFGAWYQKSTHVSSTLPSDHSLSALSSPKVSSSPLPSTSKTPPLSSYPPKSSPPETSIQNRNRSCNKPTIIITSLNISKVEADNYFATYGLKLEDTPQDKNHIGDLQINVGVGNDTYWIDKIKQDNIGQAVYDIVGCDFIN